MRATLGMCVCLASTASSSVAALVSSSPAMHSAAAAPLVGCMKRSSISMQYGGMRAQGYDQSYDQGYGQSDPAQGYGQTQAYGQNQAYGHHDQQGYGGQHFAPRQALWRVYGGYGVTGFTGVKGFAGEHLTRHWQRDDYALPYTLRNSDEQVLSRWNMLEQKLTVSRVQCKIKVEADGTAILVSSGKGPTLWREPSGPWVALQKDDQVVLGSGDQIAIDCNDPESAVFAVQDESAMQQGGGYEGQHQQHQQQGGYGQQQQQQYGGGYGQHQGGW